MGVVVKTTTQIRSDDMKCPMCGGTGQEKVYDKLTNTYIFIKCAYCNGSGKLLQTNEDWLRQCNTEQLAELLYDIRYDYQIPWKNKGVVEWLKQPHKEQS